MWSRYKEKEEDITVVTLTWYKYILPPNLHLSTIKIIFIYTPHKKVYQRKLKYFFCVSLKIRRKRIEFVGTYGKLFFPSFASFMFIAYFILYLDQLTANKLKPQKSFLFFAFSGKCFFVFIWVRDLIWSF